MAWRADVNQDLYNDEPLAYIVLSDESQAEGFFVFRFNSRNEVLFGDNFYFSLEKAKWQCKEEYGIDEDMWYEYPNPDWSSIEAAKYS